MVTTATCVVGAPLVVTRDSRRIPKTLKCFASTADSELLRSQLDRLHAEAESTRAKAAENLRRQASVSVQTGKENDARELLLQKKKVMQALDKAKSRIELLDTLSSKLNEAQQALVWFQAISVKETQLIGNISLDLQVDTDNNNTSDGGVHIVSPKPESTQENDTNDLDPQESQLTENNFEEQHQEEALTGSIFREVSSYDSFLKNLDQKLGRIEDELVNVVNVASLVLSHEDKPNNLKVQQTSEVLEEIRSVRERIANIISKEANIS
ncbi:hypothetical protein Rs2_45724 [Raphanus sativus]|nr:hypothetical protein Rs2_45724 [Raphanus sativus]